MKELVAKINEAFQAFSKDAALQVEKGNKAAELALVRLHWSLRS